MVEAELMVLGVGREDASLLAGLCVAEVVAGVVRECVCAARLRASCDDLAAGRGGVETVPADDGDDPAPPASIKCVK